MTSLTHPARKSKYNNIKESYNGRVYDSKAEARYAAQLDLMKRLPEKDPARVLSWEAQVPYEIIPGVKYIADFVIKYADGRTEVHDVKGVKRPEYKLKKKFLKHLHGVEIIEIPASKIKK